MRRLLNDRRRPTRAGCGSAGPVIVTGGELNLDMLDLRYNTEANFYQAPIHFKANGGVFLIDDFGRQLCSPKELLNRWILPLEDRHDFLTVATGKKFQVPFEQLIIFSTNLDPKDLVDDAFLRRIRHKVEHPGPARGTCTRRSSPAMLQAAGHELRPGGGGVPVRTLLQPRPHAAGQRLSRFAGNRPVDLSIQTATRAFDARPDGRGVRQLHRRVQVKFRSSLAGQESTPWTAASIAALLLIVAVAGCKTAKTTSNMPPQAASQGSMLERAFAKSPPGPMKQPAVAAIIEKESTGPLKSDTVATFAGLTVDAAFNNEELTASERDRRLDDARQKYQKALQQDPQNLEAIRGLGRLYTRLGDKERASIVYQEGMKLHPKNSQLTHEAALSYGRFEDWATALKLWEQAVSVDPDSRKYPRMIGLAHARMGNYEAGFAALMKVCGEAEARTMMARELMDAGQMAAGKEQLELALKADPNFGPARQMMDGNVQQAGYSQ